jgi:hypothetical protein
MIASPTGLAGEMRRDEVVNPGVSKETVKARRDS